MVGNSASSTLYIFGSLLQYKQISRLGLPLKFKLVQLLVALVGVGSVLFHATLKWEMQMMDELPMLFAVGMFNFCGWTATNEGLGLFIYRLEGLSKKQELMAAITLATLTLGSSFLYVYIDDPIFHQVVYTMFLVYSLFQAWKNVQRLPLSKIKASFIYFQANRPNIRSTAAQQ
jgi:dihydroceramidase